MAVPPGDRTRILERRESEIEDDLERAREFVRRRNEANATCTTKRR
jgi:hypothetical protein